MARSKKVSEFTLKFTSDVKVRFPKLQVLPSVKYLDVQALSRVPKVKIDVGVYKAHGCLRHVQAVVEAGMVTGIEVDRCSDMEPASPQLTAWLGAILKRAGRNGPRKQKPIPLGDYLATVGKEDEGTCFDFDFLWFTGFCCVYSDGPIRSLCAIWRPKASAPGKL